MAEKHTHKKKIRIRKQLKKQFAQECEYEKTNTKFIGSHAHDYNDWIVFFLIYF